MRPTSSVWQTFLIVSIRSSWPAKCLYAAVADTPTWRAASRSTTASGPPRRARSSAAAASALARSPWWYEPRVDVDVTFSILPDVDSVSITCDVDVVNICQGSQGNDHAGAVREIR